MESFESLGLREELMQAVGKLGFKTPTEIQQKAIPVLLQGERDFIGLAQTGTGKTAAFGLPALHLIDEYGKKIQALILCPTRELCIQIQNDIKEFSAFMHGIKTVAVYGGASIDNQIRDLRKGCHIVVATPGRLVDMMERRAIDLSEVKIAVLDEADEMLNMGFKEDIDFILDATPGDKKTWLFSATMPNEVRQIASNYMHNPLELTVGNKNSGNVNIEHVYYTVRAREKYAALKRIVDYYPEIYGIIFARTKIEAQEIAEHLIKDGYNADSLHGDLSQAQREKVMGRFRDRSLQLLIATDVAARGIDVDDITHVINYTLPDELEVYTHRSGRTARAGKTGKSISLVNSKEMGKIRQLEKNTRSKFKQENIPGGKEICEKQLFHIVKSIHDVEVHDKEIEPYLPSILNELKDLDKEELIKRFASMEFNRFLKYYSNAPDLNGGGNDGHDRGGDRYERGGRRDREDRGNNMNTGYVKFFISVGELDGVDKGSLLKFFNKNDLGRYEIGKINIRRTHSFFEIEPDGTDAVFENLNGQMVAGRPLRVELETGKKMENKKHESFNKGGFEKGNKGARGGDKGSKKGGNKPKAKSFYDFID